MNLIYSYYRFVGYYETETRMLMLGGLLLLLLDYAFAASISVLVRTIYLRALAFGMFVFVSKYLVNIPALNGRQSGRRVPQ